jgi:hypothetical protein
MGRQYKRGNEFPHEGFVQDAIESYFEQAGYTLDTSTHVDLLCAHPVGGEAWHIEAKSKTMAIGLDFRTCLGKLLQRMTQQHVRHGVAELKGQAQDALNKLYRATKCGTGCHLSADEVFALSLTRFGELWSDADPRSN